MQEGVVKRRLGAGVCGLVAAVLVAGCGSSSPAASSSTAKKRSFAAFTACLKQHGVTGFGGGGFPGGGQPPSGGGQPPSGAPPSGGQQPTIPAKLRKAISACADVAPRSGQGGFGPPGGFSNGT